MPERTTNKKEYDQLLEDQPHLLRKQKELRANSTKIFSQEINGVMPCILGNAELLKVKYVHRLDHEAAGYLLRIESNTKILLELLNKFQGTTHHDRIDIDDEFASPSLDPPRRRATKAKREIYRVSN